MQRPDDKSVRGPREPEHRSDKQREADAEEASGRKAPGHRASPEPRDRRTGSRDRS